MDIFFTDPSDVPLPPAEVRIRTFEVEPYPDGSRLRVTLTLTPFQKGPHCELAVFDSLGQPVASASIIEPITSHMQLTMHLRAAGIPGTAGDSYEARAVISYAAELTDPQPTQFPERTIVDQAQVTFALTR
jgi:hypothetical protein